MLLKLIYKSKYYSYLFLKASEKYTKTDMVYLAKGGFWLTFGHLYSVLTSFIITLLLANLLSKDSYGTYQYIISIVGIMGLFSLSGISTALVQSIARGFEGTLKYGFFINLKYSIITFILIICFSLYYYVNNNYEIATSLFIISFIMPLLNSVNIYQSFLVGIKNFRTSTKYFIATNTFTFLSIIITLFFTRSIIIIISISFFSNAVITTFLYLRTIRIFKPNNIVDKEIVKYSKNLSIINILNTLSFYLDSFIIFNYLGSKDLAIYSLATMMPEQIKSLFKNVASISLPKFAQRKLSQIKINIFKKMFIFGLVIIVSTILYIIIAPFIYRLLFPNYVESIYYSQIFSLSLISLILFIPISIFESHKMIDKLYKFNIITSITQIILLLVLINIYGLLGVVIGRVISRLFNLILSLIMLRRTLSLK